MSKGRWFAATLLALVAAACSSPSGESAEASPSRPDAGSASPNLKGDDVDDDAEDGTEQTKLVDYGDASAFSCDQPLSPYPVGRRCGLAGASDAFCGGARLLHYECEEEDGQPRVPNARCRYSQRYTTSEGKGITLSLCEVSACVRFDDDRCKDPEEPKRDRQGYACPTMYPFVPAAPAPPGNCERVGGWKIDAPVTTASGQLFCCK